MSIFTPGCCDACVLYTGCHAVGIRTPVLEFVETQAPADPAPLCVCRDEFDGLVFVLSELIEGSDCLWDANTGSSSPCFAVTISAQLDLRTDAPAIEVVLSTTFLSSSRTYQMDGAEARIAICALCNGETVQVPLISVANCGDAPPLDAHVLIRLA